MNSTPQSIFFSKRSKDFAYPILSLFSLFITIVVFSGCQIANDALDFQTPEGASPEFATALVDTKVSLQDILKSTGNAQFIQVEADGLIKFFYEGNSFEKTAKELINFPSQLAIPSVAPTTTLPMPIIGGMVISKTSLKAGIIRFEFNASEALNIIVTIPQLQKGAIVFSKTFTAKAGKFDSGNLDIAGYTLSPTNAKDISIIYQAQNAAGSVISNLDLKTNFENWDYTYVEGYMNQQYFNFDKQRKYINLFTDLIGTLEFISPRLNIEIENSFGVPFQANITSLSALGLKSSGFIDTLPINVANKNIDFNYPLISEAGISKKTKITFDKSNSNIASVINKNPLAIESDIDASTKSSGNKLTFINENSKLSFKSNLELPMYLTAKGFSYDLVVKKDFSILENNVEKAEIKLITDSGIPADVTLQGYFQDANNNILDSLFSGAKTLLIGAEVDANGVVTKNVRKEDLISLDNAKIVRVKNAKRLVLNFSLATSNSGKSIVRFNTNQNLSIKMGIKVKAKI